jgi:hypothetical protein
VDQVRERGGGVGVAAADQSIGGRGRGIGRVGWNRRRQGVGIAVRPPVVIAAGAPRHHGRV